MALITCKDCKREFSTDAKRCPHCGAKQPSSSLKFVVMTLLVVGIIGLLSGNGTERSGSYSSGSNKDATLKTRVIGSIGIKFTWGKEGFGNIMYATFTIHNMSGYNVKDIEITCVHTAPSGTVIDSNTRTIYEMFDDKSIRTIRNFDMGFIHSQVATSECKITDLSII
jgi:hypothetical protein